MIAVQNAVGHLIEVQFAQQITLPEVTTFRSQLAALLVKHGTVVIGVDLRSSEPFSPEVKAMLLGILRSDNPRVARAGYLSVQGTPIQAMVDEMLGVLNHPIRRAFTEPRALRTWLGPMLSEPERAELERFFK